MNNSIDVSITFSFKGEVHTPLATIDLDDCMATSGALPPIHTLLAKLNNIDTYSYQFEVMELAEIHYSNARGLATQYLKDGLFNTTGFEVAWQENQITRLLQPIASNILGIEDLNDHADLKAALMQAYKLGSDAP
ncbi:MAG: hypothetical protein LC541_20050 [Candidatus Thiodiazotropha sp.]|nr:hypothetical protein [Candidatus Thiodiazotropha sp.]MCM8885561.1 hypothetical protein [Candidatus Thiodiazotropha sp.]MCM8922014.1 hypothetical protein [Candidatus Thiodiazotropha sp.]